LEIGMLLVADPKLMLLRRPVAGMSGENAKADAEFARTPYVRAIRGVIEHDMAFRARKSRTGETVMHQGKLLPRAQWTKARPTKSASRFDLAISTVVARASSREFHAQRASPQNDL